MSEEKPNWVIILEQEIENLRNDLDKRIREVEKRIENLVVTLSRIFIALIIASNVISAIRFLESLSLSRPQLISKEIVKDLLQNVKNVLSELQAALGYAHWEFVQRLTGLALHCARRGNISFDDVASSLIEVFGSEAKNAVKLEDIVSLYGIDCADKWKRLVGFS